MTVVHAMVKKHMNLVCRIALPACSATKHDFLLDTVTHLLAVSLAWDRPELLSPGREALSSSSAAGIDRWYPGTTLHT